VFVLQTQNHNTNEQALNNYEQVSKQRLEQASEYTNDDDTNNNINDNNQHIWRWYVVKTTTFLIKQNNNNIFE